MKKNKLIIIVAIASLTISSTFIVQQKTAHAVLGVPISTQFDFHNIMSFQKNFSLDKIATMIAKQILHTMTMDIVDWINSGFNGNPAFLSNPEGFFLDAADQVTGDFIFKNGLTGLCSPFEIDIKAALYMGQAGYDKRYTCTLGTVINNYQNIPNSIYVNGGNINGFMGGDFSQGGWPAFIAMTTEPQNNPTGAYLKAKSELNARISDRGAAINLDLNRGGGFMSWEDCEEYETAISGSLSEDDFANARSITDEDRENGDTLSIGSDSSYIVKRKKCETKTPGSVIAGSVNKSLGAGQDELIAADDINAVVNALISTLARAVLTGGLKSGGGGGGGNSQYSSQLYRNMIESDTNSVINDSVQSINQDTSSQLSTITTIKSYYDKSVDLINASKTKLQEARACFSAQITDGSRSNPIARVQIYKIDEMITDDVDPLLSTLLQKKNTTDALYLNIQSVSTATSSTDLSTIQQQAESSALQQSSSIGIDQSAVNTANTDWQNAVNKNSEFVADAEDFLRDCNRNR